MASRISLDGRVKRSGVSWVGSSDNFNLQNYIQCIVNASIATVNPTSYTFSNGLNVDVSNVARLGGTLTQQTDINTSTFGLSILSGFTTMGVGGNYASFSSVDSLSSNFLFADGTYNAFVKYVLNSARSTSSDTYLDDAENNMRYLNASVSNIVTTSKLIVSNGFSTLSVQKSNTLTNVNERASLNMSHEVIVLNNQNTVQEFANDGTIVFKVKDKIGGAINNRELFKLETVEVSDSYQPTLSENYNQSLLKDLRTYPTQLLSLNVDGSLYKTHNGNVKVCVKSTEYNTLEFAHAITATGGQSLALSGLTDYEQSVKSTFIRLTANANDKFAFTNAFVDYGNTVTYYNKTDVPTILNTDESDLFVSGLTASSDWLVPAYTSVTVKKVSLGVYSVESTTINTFDRASNAFLNITTPTSGSNYLMSLSEITTKSVVAIAATSTVTNVQIDMPSIGNYINETVTFKNNTNVTISVMSVNAVNPTRFYTNGFTTPFLNFFLTTGQNLTFRIINNSAGETSYFQI